MRQARRHAVFLVALAVLAPHAVRAAEPAWWTQLKVRCGLPASTVYNDWVSRGMPCRRQTYVAPQMQTVDDSAARAEQARIAAEQQAERIREQMIADGAVPEVPAVPIAVLPELRASFVDRYNVLAVRRTTVVKDQATAKQQCDAVRTDSARYQMCMGLVNSQVSGEIQNLGIDIQNFGAALSAAPLVAPGPTPAPKHVALGPQQQAELNADRTALALLDQHRAGFARALDVIERETESQKENVREENALRDEVTQDLISDSLDALQSKYFLGPLAEKYHLSETAVVHAKETLEKLKDAAEIYASYDAARALSEDPKNADRADRYREKLLSMEQIIVSRGLGIAHSGELGEDLSKFASVEFEAVKNGTPVQSGTRYERIASALDKVVNVTGAVLPELSSLHGGVNAVGDAAVLYAVRRDSQSIRAAQQGLATARASLEKHLDDIDAQRAALKARIAAASQ
jgi:hypothetical protein